MAIQYNENIKIAAPAPLDKRYLSERTLLGSPLPYSACTEVTSVIIPTERYTGLTVNIAGVDYWFKDGILDTCLVEKKYDTNIPQSSYITGATNLGFFSGCSGIQRLEILGTAACDGCYYSEYNNYYIDSSNIVRIGDYPHGVYERRAYVNTSRTVSWIYNVPTDTWVLTPNDVALNVGSSVGCIYTSVFPNTTWSGYVFSGASVCATGSLSTGSTYICGTPIYNSTVCQDLGFRTLKTLTPTTFNLSFDDNFIYLSGATSIINIYNTGNTGTNTAGVCAYQAGNTVYLRRIVGSGSTSITETGNNIIVYSSGGTGANAINVGTGENVYSGTTGSTLLFKRIYGSGGTTVVSSSGSLVISSEAATYNLSSPSVIAVGGICSGTVLTGKTAFELFEELLVPELCGTITEPSIAITLSSSGLYEIDCNIAQSVSGIFNRGCINPQYCSISDKRSGLPNGYCFTGTGMPSGFQSCTNLSAFYTNPSYDIIIGTQTWGIQAKYDCGSPALGSKGTQYCAALPSGCTTTATNTIVGVYPLYGTTSSITTLTKQSLQNMSTATNICMQLVAETGGNKQKFEIPCAWLGAPINRPLVGICQYNTVSGSWEYPGGSAASSLTLWTSSGSTETVQGNSIGYCRYTYNGVDRSTVCIRLVF